LYVAKSNGVPFAGSARSNNSRTGLPQGLKLNISGATVMTRILSFSLALILLGCNPSPPPAEPQPESMDTTPAASEGAPAAGTESPSDRLEAVLAAQPEDIQARYEQRHPQQTLEFFGIEPGMTVVELLPGEGWYSRILVPYLGADGKLIGANYAHDMWPKFGFFEQSFIDSMETWVQDWPQQANEWQGDDGASIAAFELGSLPPEMKGTADAVLAVRALHNLARFEADGEYLTAALRNVYDILKPGGIVGVVQHQARDEMPDDWADGNAGYLKEQFVIDRMTAAGFEFVSSSDVNENPADQPTAEDIVWRLPPTFMTSAEDEQLRAQFNEIGESNRMTLLFRKPE
jgi:predicted methyltransferase